MKKDFIEFVEELFNDLEDVPENVMKYFETLKNGSKKSNRKLTDNGKLIMKYMQNNPIDEPMSAKELGEALAVSSRSVSGGMRKLVECGYIEKIGQNPVTYKITEEGMNLNINEEEGENA